MSAKPALTMLITLFFGTGACLPAGDGGNPDSSGITAVALAALPFPISNNAVASVSVGDRQFVVSFAGLGSGKSHADTLDATLILDAGAAAWRESVRLPGGVGRLASIAVSIGELAYVFGGYTVDRDGSEVSTPYVHSFDPLREEYAALSAMPVPVDDAVAVTYRDRYVYLISGWHDVGNVNLVQRYDASTDSWDQATPIPGEAVFGHAGGIVGNRIVYCDGVMIRVYSDRRRDFLANDECYLGLIDESDGRRIDWRSIESHPGLPRYRMAAGGVSSLDGVFFLGGSDNPYNYDGMGYNGEASEPVSGGLLFDLNERAWQTMPISGPATMDHRGLVSFGDGWVIVGGMLAGQEVSDQVFAYELTPRILDRMDINKSKSY